MLNHSKSTEENTWGCVGLRHTPWLQPGARRPRELHQPGDACTPAGGHQSKTAARAGLGGPWPWDEPQQLREQGWGPSPDSQVGDPCVAVKELVCGHRPSAGSAPRSERFQNGTPLPTFPTPADTGNPSISNAPLWWGAGLRGGHCLELPGSAGRPLGCCPGHCQGHLLLLTRAGPCDQCCLNATQ